MIKLKVFALLLCSTMFGCNTVINAENTNDHSDIVENADGPSDTHNLVTTTTTTATPVAYIDAMECLVTAASSTYNNVHDTVNASESAYETDAVTAGVTIVCETALGVVNEAYAAANAAELTHDAVNCVNTAAANALEKSSKAFNAAIALYTLTINNIGSAIESVKDANTSGLATDNITAATIAFKRSAAACRKTIHCVYKAILFLNNAARHPNPEDINTISDNTDSVNAIIGILNNYTIETISSLCAALRAIAEAATPAAAEVLVSANHANIYTSNAVRAINVAASALQTAVSTIMLARAVAQSTPHTAATEDTDSTIDTSNLTTAVARNATEAANEGVEVEEIVRNDTTININDLPETSTLRSSLLSILDFIPFVSNL